MACLREFSGFTFHFASIKTIFEPDAATLSSIFTFHFASIKTRIAHVWYYDEIRFTFHFASIKTASSGDRSQLASSFTFHFASIKTRCYHISIFQHFYKLFLSITIYHLYCDWFFLSNLSSLFYNLWNWWVTKRSVVLLCFLHYYTST